MGDIQASEDEKPCKKELILIAKNTVQYRTKAKRTAKSMCQERSLEQKDQAW